MEGVSLARENLQKNLSKNILVSSKNHTMVIIKRFPKRFTFYMAEMYKLIYVQHTF